MLESRCSLDVALDVDAVMTGSARVRMERGAGSAAVADAMAIRLSAIGVEEGGLVVVWAGYAELAMLGMTRSSVLGLLFRGGT
jgi:hypothetical protein